MFVNIVIELIGSQFSIKSDRQRKKNTRELSMDCGLSQCNGASVH